MTKDEIIKNLEDKNLQLSSENEKLKKFILSIKNSLDQDNTLTES